MRDPTRSRFHPRDVRGLYPERTHAQRGPLENVVDRVTEQLTRIRDVPRRELARIESQVERAARGLEAENDAALATRAARLGARLRSRGFAWQEVAPVFALVREQAGRRLGMRHFDSQLLGGWHLLEGRLAEMETGEGKTLAATLPAATVALAGVPTHVVTVNDYLTRRDADGMRPLYESLGLRVAVVLEGMGPDERRDAYAADVTYVTNKQLAFDFLRDRMTLAARRGDLGLRLESVARPDATAKRLLLRGLCYAIVDEADSVLVDEARTPLILSAAQDAGEEEELYKQALDLSRALERDTHYRVSEAESRVALLEPGRLRLAQLCEPLGGLWTGRRRREELVTQALLARHVFRRDEHYLVRDEKIQVIDEYTGRVMADRAWGRGIQQLIEAKEGCPLTGVREPLARISYQRFFRRYLHLCGMTGTAAEVAGELRATYGLRCARVPTHQPRQREDLGLRILPSLETKWSAAASRVAALHAEGRPVLVGTRSVAASDEMSAALTERGLPHQILTARQDEEEAQVVACAGEHGRITVATNMAGRGTDIPLQQGVSDRGGLAVLLTEYHDAARIDRQLAGRAARQGDRGSYEAAVSLEDWIVRAYGWEAWTRLARFALERGLPLANRLGAAAIRFAQRRAERLHRRMRRDVLRADREMAEMLAFSGREE